VCRSRLRHVHPSEGRQVHGRGTSQPR
jgi:hypothetical protein